MIVCDDAPFRHIRYVVVTMFRLTFMNGRWKRTSPAPSHCGGDGCMYSLSSLSFRRLDRRGLNNAKLKTFQTFTRNGAETYPEACTFCACPSVTPILAADATRTRGKAVPMCLGTTICIICQIYQQLFIIFTGTESHRDTVHLRQCHTLVCPLFASPIPSLRQRTHHRFLSDGMG